MPKAKAVSAAVTSPMDNWLVTKAPLPSTLATVEVDSSATSTSDSPSLPTHLHLASRDFISNYQHPSVMTIPTASAPLAPNSPTIWNPGFPSNAAASILSTGVTVYCAIKYSQTSETGSSSMVLEVSDIWVHPLTAVQYAHACGLPVSLKHLTTSALVLLLLQLVYPFHLEHVHLLHCLQASSVPMSETIKMHRKLSTLPFRTLECETSLKMEEERRRSFQRRELDW
ncbi:hypothetical protein ARMGADRAFT_1039029 [Armillaria gallica]|uniref:Uncharacterized protein n=1 Tax=Armillaria gallica TaxID=47427 RepID=A0A2H3CFH5_ARMGA|nr:hypothetical protein ARMGADRAFT_1039029 [Armillaria gallica]